MSDSSPNLKDFPTDIVSIPLAFSAIQNNGGRTYIDQEGNCESPYDAVNAIENLTRLTNKDWASVYIHIGHNAASGQVKLVHINVNMPSRGITVD